MCHRHHEVWCRSMRHLLRQHNNSQTEAIVQSLEFHLLTGPKTFLQWQTFTLLLNTAADPIYGVLFQDYKNTFNQMSSIHFLQFKLNEPRAAQETPFFAKSLFPWRSRNNGGSLKGMVTLESRFSTLFSLSSRRPLKGRRQRVKNRIPIVIASPVLAISQFKSNANPVTSGGGMGRVGRMDKRNGAQKRRQFHPVVVDRSLISREFFCCSKWTVCSAVTIILFY